MFKTKPVVTSQIRRKYMLDW